MTTLCGGAASQAKPGFTPTIVVGTAGLAALLNNVPVVWAVPFAMLLAAVSYDLSMLCNTDPPPLPTMTAYEMAVIANPLLDPVASLQASQKFNLLIRYYAWFAFCECATVATPAPAAAPAAPANLPMMNPPVATPVPAAPCWVRLATAQNGGTPILHKNISAALLPPGATRASSNGGIAGLEIHFPANPPTRVRLTLTTNNEDPGGHIDCEIQFSNNAGAQTGQLVTSANANLTSVAEGDVPAGSTYWEVGFGENGGTGALTASVEVMAWCGGSSSTTVASPCCPPDAVATGMMQQILTAVTLLQRQLVPFAYVDGTSHAGLSGAGSITVQGLLGLRMDLTTIPASLRQDSSVPPFIFNGGWVSMLDANGFIEETRVHAEHRVWFPHTASDATVIGYSLAPGVVATITELNRES